MDFFSFVEGPLVWVVFLIFIVGIITRLAFFISAIIRNSGDKDSTWSHYLGTFGRSILPFHRAVVKRPIYATLRYLFHICLIAVPVWLAGILSYGANPGLSGNGLRCQTHGPIG